MQTVNETSVRRLYALAALLLLSVLLGLLAGCGGGASGVAFRKVTVVVRWPSTSRKISRASVSSAQSVTVEVFDGVTSISRNFVRTPSGTSASTLTLDLPAKALTLYANAYAYPAGSPVTDYGYVTNPATGQPINPAADKRPVAHAVTVADLSKSNAQIIFTLENTIASLVPITTPADKTTYTLDDGVVALDNTVQALTSDGAVVLTGPNALVWSLDNTNALENARAQLSPLNPDTSKPDQTDPAQLNPVLTLKASGVVHVTVTDSEVNADAPNNELPLKTTIAYTIKPHVTAPNLTLDGGASGLLRTHLPLYAKSVTFSITQSPLVAPPDVNAAPAGATGTPVTLDSPPPPVTVTQNTTFTPAPALVNSTVTLNAPLKVAYVASGRDVTLKAQAFSGPNGTGALLADGQIVIGRAALPTSDTVEQVDLTTPYVRGFALTPANPVITLNGTATGFGGDGVNTLKMQITALVNASDPSSVPSIPIDPRTVQVASANTAVATLSTPLSPLDSNGNPYLLATGVSDGANVAATSRTDVLTVTEPRLNIAGKPIPPGTITLTVNRVNSGFTFD